MTDYVRCVSGGEHARRTRCTNTDLSDTARRVTPTRTSLALEVTDHVRRAQYDRCRGEQQPAYAEREERRDAQQEPHGGSNVERPPEDPRVGRVDAGVCLHVHVHMTK